MDELIQLVVTKTGISTEQARGAVETVIAQLKSRLPGPIAGQIDTAVQGGTLNQAANLLGGLFGKS